MSLRATFKKALKSVYGATADMWFLCTYYEYADGIDLLAPEQETLDDTYTFDAFDISYDKELEEGQPYTSGSRVIGFDYDSIPAGSKFLRGQSVTITHPTDGTLTEYEVKGVRIEGQDVLYIVRLEANE